MIVKRYKTLKERRKLRVRAKIRGTKDRPRLSVFRSNKHIYAQLIDDDRGETLTAASDLELESISGTKTEIACKVGKVLAEKALKLGVKKVVFDRGGYKYHGRVKALAEGARQGGLEF